MMGVFVEIVALIVGISSYFWVSRLGGVLILVGFLLYMISKMLMIKYINKNTPGLIDIDLKFPPPPGKPYFWEDTAGTGAVPKWVSMMGLLGPALVIIGFLFSLGTLFI